MLKKNIYTVTVSLIILYLSLATPKSIVRTGVFDIPHFDKLAHFGLYFLLMATMILEHRKSLTNTRKLLLISLIPLFFGITIEFIQSLFTKNRMGEILDGIADAAGIAAAVLLWIFFRPYYYLKEKIK
ncbi:MAG: VanZ family protein [Bacteroidales bacterium]|nr:VanZ family protein [Bacteroidales bacterium]